MSAIPPNSIAAILQTAGAAQRAASARQAAESADHERSPDRFPDQLSLAIRESDADTEVYADAEGQGGSGRERRARDDEQEIADDSNDLRSEDSDPHHIDLTA